MSNELMLYEPHQLDLIRKALAPSLSVEHFELFIEYCKRTNLDPLKRQIYAWAANDKTTNSKKLVVVTSIDGYRSIAQRTGRYLGQTKQEWCGKDGVWVDIWLKAEPPFAARVGVFVKGINEPTYAVAIYKQYLPGKEESRTLWNKFPDLMISKCAEALALRKAFPEDLAGLYVEDEINEQSNNYSATIEKPAQLPTVDLTKQQSRPYTPDYLIAKLQAAIENNQLTDVITESEQTELEGLFEKFLDAKNGTFKTFYETCFNLPVGYIERRCYDALRQWMGVKYSTEGEVIISKHAKTEFIALIGVKR